MKTLAIADLFCGAGGTSAGAVEAVQILGYRPALKAFNHWEVACNTHRANHPEYMAYCADLDSAKPHDYFKPGELDLLWASPECTHHSVARGGKPINDQSRATAWCVVRWAEALQPDFILVENVPEFETWGAICANGRPMKSKRGATFLAWVAAIESLGYSVDWRVICAADYGDPTTRRRLFVQAVRGRRKIVWPDPTHAPKESTDLFGNRKAWVPARDIIDWSLQGKSVYERKRPLSPKTMRRIMAGLEKFGLKPFIVPQQSNPTPKGVDEPLPTVVADGSGAKLAQPYIIHLRGTQDGQIDGSAKSLDAPTPAVSCSGAHLALVEPIILSAGGPECPARPVSEPMGTVLTRDHRALAEPFLIPQHGTHAARSIDKPAPTVTTTSRGVGLAEPYLIQMEHGGNERSIDRPMPTITTAKGGAIGVAQPFLIHTAHGKNRPAYDVAQPAPTVTGNRGDLAIIEPGLLPQQSGGQLRPVDDPAPTVSTGGAVGLVEPYLVKYYGAGVNAESVNDPLATVTANDRFGLVRPVVVVNGERYLLDIRFRMLQPHELAGAQGFRKGYVFTGTKTDQVKQIGNAVPRNLARALVLAVLSQRSDIADLLRHEAVA